MPFAPLLRVIRVVSLFAAVASATWARAQLNSQEERVATLLTNAYDQHRPFVPVDPILPRVARARAIDLARRNYFDHVNPDGHGPNYLVRQAGYSLPATYDQSARGNKIESIAAGDTN